MIHDKFYVEKFYGKEQNFYEKKKGKPYDAIVKSSILL